MVLFFGRSILPRDWVAKMAKMACFANVIKITKMAWFSKIAILGAI